MASVNTGSFCINCPVFRNCDVTQGGKESSIDYSTFTTNFHFSNKQDDKPKLSVSDKAETTDKSDGRLKTLVNAEKKQLQMTIVKKRENVRQYFFTRFFNYISNYNEVFEKRFPAAYTVYRVFTVGVKDFFADMKSYFKINSIKNDRGLQALTRKEIEHWKKMPADMMKVAPVLLISALPFANYVVFPLA